MVIMILVMMDGNDNYDDEWLSPDMVMMMDGNDNCDDES